MKGTTFQRAVIALILAVGVTGAGVGFGQEDAAVTPLPALRLDPASVTVSGLSSGAFMAVQVHVAHSAGIAGAAVFAGGPYGCARADTSTATLTQALAHCVRYEDLSWNPFHRWRGPPDVQDLVADAKALAAADVIDPLEGLAEDRVYLFSGRADDTVPRSVVEALARWYRHFVPADALARTFDVNAGHAMITDSFGNPCPASEPPYINDCDVDGARLAFGHLYGGLREPAGVDGRVIAFDQRPFIPEDAPEYHGLHPVGHLYVPDACTDGAADPCRLHVSFHGCEQTERFIGDDWWTQAGYNAWAAANRIVVLYPQAQASERSVTNPLALPNPKGCWDWWGYTGQDYLTREGVQIRAIWGMIEHLTAGAKP